MSALGCSPGYDITGGKIAPVCAHTGAALINNSFITVNSTERNKCCCTSGSVPEWLDIENSFTELCALDCGFDPVDAAGPLDLNDYATPWLDDLTILYSNYGGHLLNYCYTDKSDAYINGLASQYMISGFSEGMIALTNTPTREQIYDKWQGKLVSYCNTGLTPPPHTFYSWIPVDSGWVSGVGGQGIPSPRANYDGLIGGSLFLDYGYFPNRFVWHLNLTGQWYNGTGWSTEEIFTGKHTGNRPDSSPFIKSSGTSFLSSISVGRYTEPYVC